MSSYDEALKRKLNHDIRSKMNIVMGYCDLLLEESDQSNRQDLLHIQRAAAELLVITAEIRQLSAPTSPAEPVNLEQSYRNWRTKLDQLNPPLSFDTPDNVDVAVPHPIWLGLKAVLDRMALKIWEKGNVALQYQNDATQHHMILDISTQQQPSQAVSNLLATYADRGTPDIDKDFDRFFVHTIANENHCQIDAEVSLQRIILSWQDPR